MACKCGVCQGRRRWNKLTNIADTTPVLFRANADRVMVAISALGDASSGVFYDPVTFRVSLSDNPAALNVITGALFTPVLLKIEEYGIILQSDLTIAMINLGTGISVTEIFLRGEHDDLGSMTELVGK